MKKLLSLYETLAAGLFKYRLYLFGVLMLISAFFILRFFFLAGQVSHGIEENGPPKSKREVRKLEKKVVSLGREKALAIRRADSTYQRVVVRDPMIARLQQEIDSLKTFYHASTQASDTAGTSPAAIRRYLANYRPGPDAL